MQTLGPNFTPTTLEAALESAFGGSDNKRARHFAENYKKSEAALAAAIGSLTIVTYPIATYPLGHRPRLELIVPIGEARLEAQTNVQFLRDNKTGVDEQGPTIITTELVLPAVRPGMVITGWLALVHPIRFQILRTDSRETAEEGEPTFSTFVTDPQITLSDPATTQKMIHQHEIEEQSHFPFRSAESMGEMMLQLAAKQVS